MNRRGFAIGAGSLALAGCAHRPVVEVNAALFQPSEEGAAQLDTGLDPNRRITAPVRINGQGPFDFVVDTGANRTVISAELALALGLPDGGPADVHGVAGVEAVPTVQIGQFDADSILVKDIRAPALPRERLGADGLLGVDVLQDRRVLIDFAARRLSITRGRGGPTAATGFGMRQSQTGLSRESGPSITVPARYRFGQLIIIGADVYGHRVMAFVDSGSQSTVGNNALRSLVHAGSPSEPSPARQLTDILSATGQTAQGEVARMPMLKVGGLRIAGLSMVFADLHVFELWGLLKQPSLVLGVDLLGRFRAVELDYARREVTFHLHPAAATH